jgi:hypothetical protein
MYHIKLIIFIIAMLLFTSVSEAKKRCKPLLEKLHNIQAMQRSGYSSQGGLSLRGREDKARDNWWQCEQGRGGKTKKKTKTKHKKNRKNKSIQYSATYKQSTQVNIPAGTPFKTNNTIVIKSQYQGNKKRAWIKFYQQPVQCNRPKNLAVFVYCSEDKKAQRSDFEQEYE